MTFRIASILGLGVAGLAGLSGWRALDCRADSVEMARLKSMQPRRPPLFSRDMITNLPEPAQRFFIFAIREGTPLYTVAELKMHGGFGMGDNAAPRYLDMRASQVLAAPYGFVWRMSAGGGARRMSGSDSASWTRFWVGGLIPVARFGETDRAVKSVNAEHNGSNPPPSANDLGVRGSQSLFALE